MSFLFFDFFNTQSQYFPKSNTSKTACQIFLLQNGKPIFSAICQTEFLEDHNGTKMISNLENKAVELK